MPNGKKGKRGGARPGAGRPKGKQTIEKEQARLIVRERVFQHLGPMLDAQIKHAQGISYFVVREKKGGKFVRVTSDMAQARVGVQDSEEIVEVWSKDPSVQAFTDLLNRALDKPAEQPHAVDVNFPQMTEVLSRLEAGRKRLSNGKSGTKH